MKRGQINMFVIAFYGRINNDTGCLANLTDGGEGMSGWVPSEETRQKDIYDRPKKKR